MYTRGLRGYEKLGLEHTLNTINNLGNLYFSQDKLVKAEEMFTRALREYEKLEFENQSMLSTMNNLGVLYHTQGRLTEAE